MYDKIYKHSNISENQEIIKYKSIDRYKEIFAEYPVF